MRQQLTSLKHRVAWEPHAPLKKNKPIILNTYEEHKSIIHGRAGNNIKKNSTEGTWELIGFPVSLSVITEREQGETLSWDSMQGVVGHIAAAGESLPSLFLLLESEEVLLQFNKAFKSMYQQVQLQQRREKVCRNEHCWYLKDSGHMTTNLYCRYQLVSAVTKLCPNCCCIWIPNNVSLHTKRDNS